MPNETSQRIYEEGNYGFMCAELQDNNTYGTVNKIEGLVSVSLTFSQTTEQKAADDNPSYVTTQSPLKGEGTITFFGMTKQNYIDLYRNVTDASGALVFGRRGVAKRLGVSFFNTAVSATGKSTNKITLNNVLFSLPPFNSQTLQEDDTTIREFAIPVTCSAYSYTTRDGGRDTVTWSILNSETESALYNEFKEQIYIPDSADEEL